MSSSFPTPKPCLFNLIAYTEESGRLIHLDKIIAVIAEKFPCQIIIVQGEPQNTTSDLSIEVSSSRVKIVAPEKHLEQVPLVVLPHLLPDFPTLLISAVDPIKKNRVLDSLAKIASRLIYESGLSANLNEFAEKWSKKPFTSLPEFIDIDWARLSGWRTVLLEIFDNERKIEMLKNSTHINIVYNAQVDSCWSNVLVLAQYCQAWLASCLNWQFVSQTANRGVYEITYNQGKHPVKVTLSPEETRELSPGSIIRMEIHGEPSESVIIHRKNLSQQINVHIACAETCDLPYSLVLPNTLRGFSYLQQLLFQKMGPQYMKMIKLLGTEAP